MLSIASGQVTERVTWTVGKICGLRTKRALVLLTSEQDVLEKMAYTLANPTSAGLVSIPLRIGRE